MNELEEELQGEIRELEALPESEYRSGYIYAMKCVLIKIKRLKGEKE